MDHFVVVDRLPADFTIPADLGDRLRYDESSRKLYFHGYMSKAEYDRLCQLTQDWPFKRKLEHLFQSCIYTNKTPSKSFLGLLSLFRHRVVPG